MRSVEPHGSLYVKLDADLGLVREAELAVPEAAVGEGSVPPQHAVGEVARAARDDEFAWQHLVLALRRLSRWRYSTG